MADFGVATYNVRKNGFPSVVYLNGVQWQLADGDYAYPIIFDGLPANSSSPTTVRTTFSQDTYFLWAGSKYWADIAKAAFTRTSAPIPNVLITRTLGGSAFEYAETQITSLANGPVADEPKWLGAPFWFAGGQVLVVNARNADAADAYNFRYELWGGLYKAG